MNQQVIEAAREVLGQHLAERRESKSIKRHDLTKAVGLRHEQIVAIETGTTGYTIDNFLKYIHAIDCYLFISDKEGKHLDHQHMMNKAKKDNPYGNE